MSQIKISFEFFPPKKAETLPAFYETVQRLKEFNPEFMSVTYGALGTNQDQTLDIVTTIQNQYAVDAAAHFTCIGSDESDVDQFVSALRAAGVTRMIALRGDIPDDVSKEDVLTRFMHASDLVAYVKDKYPDLYIAVAGYPESHPEAVSLNDDIQRLAEKVSLGADAVVTQLFFDNEVFLNFKEKARAAGVTVPIVPGIMPVTNYRMIERITQMCGVHVPDTMKKFFAADPTLEDTQKYALDFTLQQCQDLQRNGVEEFHFYTLNQARVIEDVCRVLQGG